MHKFKNESGSEGVECVEEVRRFLLVTSTQGRYGAGGDIAGGAEGFSAAIVRAVGRAGGRAARQRHEPQGGLWPKAAKQWG